MNLTTTVKSNYMYTEHCVNENCNTVYYLLILAY